MSAARLVIQKFGSQSALGQLIGKGQTTIQHWGKTGIIPAKWQPVLLRLAAEKGIDLSASDFISHESEVEATLSDEPKIPKATYWGVLPIADMELPVFVLENGLRVISRTGATGLLSDRRGGGNLENYLQVSALQPYVPPDLSGLAIEFLLHITNKRVIGYSAETFLEICQAYVRALAAGALDTDRQKEIAVKASMFLAACAKVGLVALIDEVTGHQYDRAADALTVKLKAYLSEEMRTWEKTFPDELWMEFGRLTNWKGSVTQRPKYWGHLVTELIYQYLDADVCKWLKDNKPQPQKGRNWHLWLSEQYGLRKLIQHIYTLIGIAKTCTTMRELRDKMAEMYGKIPVQMTMYVSTPTNRPISDPDGPVLEPEID